VAVDGPADNLDQALEKARRELTLLDPTWMASRSGTSYSFADGTFAVPFFGEEHVVTFPAGRVARPGGAEAAGRDTLIILHYLIGADGMPVKEEWVAYRDLPGARYHEPAFVAEVERPLSQGLAGRFDDLRRWARDRATAKDVPGDIAVAWYALPRVPLLLIFNEADEEFAAGARMLFDISAPDYLPTEDLSVLAEIATQHLLSALT
jgi:Domain of unknown function (DUF3786)